MQEDDLRQLLGRKTENKNLDYKEKFNWESASNDEKFELVKDILSMFNTQDGGKIVFGIRDDDYELIGMPDEDYRSFDPTKVNDFLHRYTEPKFSCQVHKIVNDGKKVVAIDVPEFMEIPILCKEDANSSKPPHKQILKRGQIYIRTDKGSSEAISTSEEMRELLGRALVKRGDELLRSIERLIKGKAIAPTEESIEKYKVEISDAEKFFSETIGNELKKYACWEIYAYPVDYNPKRFQDQKSIKELIQKAEVELRGWNFPHTEPSSNARSFVKGRESFTVWEEFREGYRAYLSGLFIWKSALWEDTRGYQTDGKKVLSFEMAIYSITEFFLFLKRYYEQIAPEADLSVRIILNGTKDRKIISLDPAIHLHDDYSATDGSIPFEEIVKVVDLKVSFKEIANRVVRQIFAAFNWDNIAEATVEGWQSKLLQRKP